jgi:toxin CcdB
MAQYDVFRQAGIGYLLDVQSDLLEVLNTRVVVPLMPLDQAPRAARRLNPVFDIEGQAHVMVTQYLSAVRGSELGPRATTLEARFDAITAALDMMYHGY